MSKQNVQCSAQCWEKRVTIEQCQSHVGRFVSVWAEPSTYDIMYVGGAIDPWYKYDVPMVTLPTDFPMPNEWFKIKKFILTAVSIYVWVHPGQNPRRTISSRHAMYVTQCTWCDVHDVMYVVWCTWCDVRDVMYVVWCMWYDVRGVMYDAPISCVLSSVSNPIAYLCINRSYPATFMSCL